MFNLLQKRNKLLSLLKHLNILTMKRVTQKELATILLSTKIVKGMPMFASVLQLTDARALKKDRVTKEKNPFEAINKLSKVSILLNSEYQKAVINQLAKEGKEESEYKRGENTMPIEFGENNNFIGTFKGEFVLQYRPNDNVMPKVKYIADSKVIDKKKIENFLPTVQPATNQGTEREILWRKLYLKNVRKIAVNGETYKVID
jgi:hypothetical protein